MRRPRSCCAGCRSTRRWKRRSPAGSATSSCSSRCSPMSTVADSESPSGVADQARQLDLYLRHVAIEKGRSPNTVAAYRRDLEAMLVAGPAFEPAALAGYVRGLRERPEPLAASSIARTISSIRGFMGFLVDEGLLDADPAADLVAPKQPARLPKALTIEQ